MTDVGGTIEELIEQKLRALLDDVGKKDVDGKPVLSPKEETDRVKLAVEYSAQAKLKGSPLGSALGRTNGGQHG